MRQNFSLFYPFTEGVAHRGSFSQAVSLRPDHCVHCQDEMCSQGLENITQGKQRDRQRNMPWGGGGGGSGVAGRAVGSQPKHPRQATGNADLGL